MDHSIIRDACLKHPGYVGGTAYERTKVCCGVLLQLGESIPSWMVIREIIERGSSADISRGVKDFRAEHAERLRQMSGLVSGLPEHLAVHVRGFWEAAVVAARQSLDHEAAEFRAQVQEADERALLATQAAERAQAETAAACDQVESLRDRLASDAEVRAQLQQQLERERELRHYAEQMREESAAELAKQRVRLEETLAQSQVEMKQVLERFDGERRHSLLQIEEARRKADREVQAIRDHAIRTEAELRRKLDDATHNNSALRSQFDQCHSKIATLMQERDDLRTAVSRLEQQNRSMVELVKKAKPGPAQLGVKRGSQKALRRKNVRAKS